MNAIRKTSILLLTLLLLTGFAAADLTVQPDAVNETLEAGEEHSFEFTFNNTNENQTIDNITLEQPDWLSWNNTGFQINESDSQTVEATFYTETEQEFNTALETQYDIDGNTSIGPFIEFNADTYYPDTEVSVDVFQQSFEQDFEETAESVFLVENTGNETAYNVNLTGENTGFDINESFDLETGEDVLVEYQTTVPLPEEDITDATNQTYNQTVSVTGENFQVTGFDVEIFVPFQEYDEEERQRDLVELMREFQEFCDDPANQDLPICGGDVIEVVEEEEVVEETTETNVTLSEEEVRDLQDLANGSIDTTAEVEEALARQDNRTYAELNSTFSDIETHLEQDQQATQETTQAVNELTEYLESRERSRFIRNTLVMFFALIMLSFGGFAAFVKILLDSSRDQRI